jgi:hypothetical protein
VWLSINNGREPHLGGDHEVWNSLAEEPVISRGADQALSKDSVPEAPSAAEEARTEEHEGEHTPRIMGQGLAPMSSDRRLTLAKATSR